MLTLYYFSCWVPWRRHVNKRWYANHLISLAILHSTPVALLPIHFSMMSLLLRIRSFSCKKRALPGPVTCNTCLHNPRDFKRNLVPMPIVPPRVVKETSGHVRCRIKIKRMNSVIGTLIPMIIRRNIYMKWVQMHAWFTIVVYKSVSRIFLALDVSTSCKSIGGSHQWTFCCVDAHCRTPHLSQAVWIYWRPHSGRYHFGIQCQCQFWNHKLWRKQGAHY